MADLTYKLKLQLSNGTELEAGSFTVPAGSDGLDGQDGATFTPVMDANGNLSWTNNKGLQNPSPVNIKGEAGPAGNDGESAYELYVDNGGTLTEEQWLASLHASNPEFVDSVEQMTDQSKYYVLTTDGEIYTYGTKSVVRPAKSYYNKADVTPDMLNKRYSGTPGSITGGTGHYITAPVEVDLSNDSPLIFRVEGAALYSVISKIVYLDSAGVAVGSPYLEVTYNYCETHGNYSLIYVGYATKTEKHPYYDSIAKVRFSVARKSSEMTMDEVFDFTVVDNAGGQTTTETGWFSTGMTYTPADYEQRIIAVENQIQSNTEEINQLKTLVEDGRTGAVYPAFWEGAVAECISKIKALQVGRHCVTFPFFSDNHQRLGYAGALIAKVMAECYIPYCLYGGDSISSGYIETEAEMIEQDRKFDTMMKPVPNGRLCRTVGNHDGYWRVSADEAHTYTNAQVYELFLREESVSQLKHFGENGTYYYVEDIASKVRFIVLNSNGGFGETQRNWLQNTALQFSESGWAVVFVSHAPVTNNFHANIADAQAMQTILTNYINGSSTNKADVIGWFSGHIHRDRIYQCDHTGNTEADDQTTATLPWKTVTITSDHTSIAYDDATKHTVGNDDQSHAIDFVTVNKTAKTVNITRLGIGNDRSYSYA